MGKRGKEEYFEKGHVNWIIFLVYIVFGVYFLNYPLKYFKIPEMISNFDIWIIFAGGILMLFGAINYFRASR